MASPHWIMKTAALALILGTPAFLLLRSVPRIFGREGGRFSSVAAWIGIIFLVTYIGWVLNMFLLWWALGIVIWPLFGIVLSVAGMIAGLFAGIGQRWRLLSAFVILLLWSIFSIIMPN